MCLGEIDIPTPWLFEIQTDRGIGTYCGVLEFVAPEAQIVLPSWVRSTHQIYIYFNADDAKFGA